MALETLDLTSVDPALKQIYRPRNVEDMTFDRRPLIAMLSKFEGFGGRDMPVVAQFGNPQGRSAVFATAQQNATAAKLQDFLLTRIRDFSVANVDGETAEATEGDSESFLSAMSLQIDGAIKSLANANETFAYRSGTGSLGALAANATVRQGVTSSTASDTILLTKASDAKLFEVGMTLKASATDGGALRTGSELVKGVQRGLIGALISTSATWATVITAIAGADFLSVEGDGAAGGASKKFSGLASWLPETAPTTGDSHFGVDRSVDSRLFGNFVDASGGSLVEEAIIDGQSVAASEGGAVDTTIINHVKNRLLVKQLGSKVEYERVSARNADGGEATVGFNSVLIHGDEGLIKVVAANKCQEDIAWVLQMDTWEIPSLRALVHMLMLDGLKILRVATDDAYEVRVGTRGQMSCNAPGWNSRVKLA